MKTFNVVSKKKVYKDGVFTHKNCAKKNVSCISFELTLSYVVETSVAELSRISRKRKLGLQN